MVDVGRCDLSQFDAATSEGFPGSRSRVRSGLCPEELHAHVGWLGYVPAPGEVAGDVHGIQRAPRHQALEIAGFEQLEHPRTDLLVRRVPGVAREPREMIRHEGHLPAEIGVL